MWGRNLQPKLACCRLTRVTTPGGDPNTLKAYFSEASGPARYKLSERSFVEPHALGPHVALDRSVLTPCLLRPAGAEGLPTLVDPEVSPNISAGHLDPDLLKLAGDRSEQLPP